MPARVLTSILFFSLILMSPLHAQWRTRALNIGLSYGFGGTHGFYAPSLDLSWRGTWLRFGLAPAYMSVSANQDLFRLINTDTDILAILLSAGYHRTNDTWVLEYRGLDLAFVPVDGLHALVGIRFDTGKRLSIRYLAGWMHNRRRDQGNFVVTDRGGFRNWPTMELGIGLRLFPVRMGPPPTTSESHEE